MLTSRRGHRPQGAASPLAPVLPALGSPIADLPGAVFMRRAALAAGLAMACGAAAPPALARITVPPLLAPATTEHHPGKFIFATLVTPDLAAAKSFYGRLFGWTFQDVPGGNAPYAQAMLNGDTVGALVQKPMPPGERRQPAWIQYLATTDVDAAAAATTSAGGRVLSKPHDLPNRGREAILADPQGAVFGALASSSGDPPDTLKPVGEWIWHAAIATDPMADAAFYKTVFGEQIEPLPQTPGETHVLLVTEEYARASVNSLPVARPDLHPHWLGFVRVPDASAAAAQVTALGGHVVVQPQMDRHGGKVAVVTDPLGAAFGLFEWSSSEPQQVRP